MLGNVRYKVVFLVLLIISLLIFMNYQVFSVDRVVIEADESEDVHPRNEESEIADLEDLANLNDASDTYPAVEESVPIVLMYHHIDPNTDGTNAAIIDDDSFVAQMEYIATNDYNTMTVTEWMELTEEQQRASGKTVIITIDDGYESVYTYMLPVLVEYGIKASVYPIVASTPGEKNNPGIPHLTWEQMQEMVDTGLIEIGSHTYDLHHYVEGHEGRGAAMVTSKWLPELERYETQEEFQERVREDLILSKTMLEERLGIEVTSLSYPYGRWTEEVEMIGREVGYEYFLTLDSEAQREGQMTRVNVSPGLTLEKFVKLIEEH